MSAPRLAEQFEDLAKQEEAARLGMWVFLGSETLLFAGLFALYAAYRTMYPDAFAAGPSFNDVAIGTTNTVVLITSSLFVALALHEVRVAQPRRAGMLLVAAIALGCVFLALKGAEYASHFRAGILPGAGYRFAALPAPGAGMFFTIYFMMTGLHALHVIAGMIILSWLASGCFRRVYSAAYDTPLEIGGLYWHLVDVMWIFLWPLLYLIHR